MIPMAMITLHSLSLTFMHIQTLQGMNMLTATMLGQMAAFPDICDSRAILLRVLGAGRGRGTSREPPLSILLSVSI